VSKTECELMAKSYSQTADVSKSTLNDGLCCPHCGGRSGFILKALFSVEQSVGWDGHREHGDIHLVRENKLGKCAECGNTVKAT
jgi:DNA-directed RNA polymerase subunit RPC12/RpoP